MTMTDIYDDAGIDAPQLHEIIANERVPEGRQLAEITQADLVKMSSLNFSAITAKRCEVERDQGKVLRLLREAAAMGGSEFYYSFPVKKKGGGTDQIEGISIDGAMAAMQCYGNCEVDCRPIDIGHAWIFLARFVDHERGTSLIRPFLQRKEGSRMGGVDDGRRLEIAFNIGASKATRNVIANAIRPFTTFCFNEAKNDLVKRVGARLPEHKERVTSRLAELGVELKRVEMQHGKVLADMAAREVAGILTQISSVRQGLAMANDIWPVEIPAEPRRSDAPAQGGQPEQSTAAPLPSTTAAVETAAQPSPPAAEPSPRDWRVPDDIVGQSAVLSKLDELLAATNSDADQDEFERVNAERISKITGLPRSQFNARLRERRDLRKGG